jgi:formylglycine-generating enzyme
MTIRASRLGGCAGVLLLAIGYGCSRELPPTGQIVLHVDTDAILPDPIGAPPDTTRLSPLVDRARFEVLVDGDARPISARDVVVDAAMFHERRVSFGIVPPASVTTVKARVLLFRADRVLADTLESGVTLETLVALPAVPAEGIVDVSVILHADDFGLKLGPLAPQPGSIGQSLVNTWHGGHRVPCSGGARPGEACVPGGAFFFGNPQFRGRTPSNDIYVERLVSLSPFFLDLTEVTVGDLRKALPQLSARGAPPPKAFSGRKDRGDFTDFCTWTEMAGERDGLPVNCVSWDTARAYCQELEKDLPTEAQNEFVTSGLGEEWAFPWGNDEPDCSSAVWGRGGIGVTSTDPQLCREPGSAGGPGFPGSGTSDRLGSNVLRNAGGEPVVDLGGNLSEWMLDRWGRPTDPFWDTIRPMADPVDDVASTFDVDSRVARGGSWQGTALTTRGGFRRRRPASPLDQQLDAFTGFRCARPGRGG